MVSKLKFLQKNEGFMKYLKNMSWLFLEKLLRVVVGLFIGVWIARYLGPENFGIFSYAQSFVGLFVAFASLGIDSIIVREIVKNEILREKLLNTAFWIKIMGSIIVVVSILITINFTTNTTFTNLIIFIMTSSTIFQSFNVINLHFQSKVQSKYIVYSNIIFLFISSILKIVLIINDANVVAFAWMVVVDSILQSVFIIYFYIKCNNKITSIIQLNFDFPYAKNILRDSWPLILTTLAISVYMQMDQIMIHNMLGSYEVGQYTAALRISEGFYFIPAIIVGSLFPAIVNSKELSSTIYYSRLQKLYDLMVFLALLIILPMTFLSDYVIDLLYGKEYSQSATVLLIHIWTSVFVFLGVAFSMVLASENKTLKSFYRTLFGAVANVILNYILIPKYGINGAAIATLISQIMANYVYDFFDKDLHEHLKMKTKSFFPIHILKGYK